MISCCALLQLLLGNMGRPGRRHHGAARACRHSGLDRRPDAVPQHPRVHESPDGAQEARRHCATIITTETPPGGYWANLPKFMVSYLKSMYGGSGDPREQLGLRLASEDPRRPLAHGDDGRDGRRAGQGDVLRRTESGDVAQRRRAARGHAEARVAGGQGQLADRDRHAVVHGAGDQERRA